ncbi:PFL family protein [Caldicellulosiruptoraceae bacterium PP1]
MFSRDEIISTINMVKQENLDIRTITIGISLYDCVSDNVDIFIEKMKRKIYDKANNITDIAREIEEVYGIPIINKRVATTPISLVCGDFDEEDLVKIATSLDEIAESIGIDLIGGFSALVQKGFSNQAKRLLNIFPEAISQTKRVCSSVNVGSTKAGINLDAINIVAKGIKKLSELTKDEDSFGCAKFVVFANAPEDNPFMAGAFHGIGENDVAINIGISGPGVVKRALEKVRGQDISTVYETIKKTAFKITRAGQIVGDYASKKLDIPFGIIDLSLAPTPRNGDSIAEILEEIGLEKVGAYGSTAILALLNDAVKKGGSMAARFVGGLSGAFIPVSEDLGMVEAVDAGALSLEKLEAMTAVCSVGLDMVIVPGSTPWEVISALIADEIAIGVYNNKTTGVRIIPAFNKDVGDVVNFGGLLGGGKVMKINTFSPEVFVNRGGKIPPPIISLRN